MDAELWAAIRRLHEVEKLSKSAVAERLKIHRWTVRRALASKNGPPQDKPRHSPGPGKLDAYKGYLQERIRNYPELSAKKLLIEIRRQGYGGGYTIIKDYLQTIRPDKEPQAFLRLETLPGEFAQVDWANIGAIAMGNAKRKLSCFVMVLSFSRMVYIEFTLSQCLEDFIACHLNAFRFFGGVVQKINYDNLKTVVLLREGSLIRFHPKFMDFAGTFLFEPIPCGVRKAWEKGKVESGIKYVRSAFLAGREIVSWHRIRQEADDWRDQEANCRIHGATRERPIDRFVQEKILLQSLPAKEYDCRVVRTVAATSQALVHFDANRYSIPYQWAKKKALTLKAAPGEVRIFEGTRLLATHLRCYEKYRIIENPSHYEGLLAQRKKARAAKSSEAFLALAPDCQEYFKGLMASEVHVPSHIEKILDMTRLYGKGEVVSAILQALKFGAFSAAYIQNIIAQNRAARNLTEPQPVVLTKKPQWAKVEVEQTDLSLYDELFEGSGKESLDG
jgi:transposase